ncbi:MAG TPA: Re/Si-specific NAD(P)(+) transhydrogenase subunit alpha [Pirellulaceae bacterium]|nr:Re/Si-specific NAD(P)(+) transhydrogenase subunit alpha [Pirellulaceae bacterium]
MKVAVVKETFPGERRVALVPADVAKLVKNGLGVIVEPGAGVAAGFVDKAYADKGAQLATNRAGALSAEVVLQVRSLGASLKAGRDDLRLLRNGQIVIGLCDPLGEPRAIAELAQTGATVFALELIPRTTRAQAMDVLSSMTTLAGYRAVLLAAVELPKIFPLMMTAAGTLTAARVFVIGVGVAGLSAIATAKRLGAVVRAYDVRPACREQVESLGAKFVELPIETKQAETAGGYAQVQDQAFYQRQQELLGDVVAESDVVISTAAIPGKQSPLLITAEAVARMQPGSVIVDLGAERGGNCALTKADERVLAHGVTILGPTNLPSEVPYHASQMFSANVTAFLINLVPKGQLVLNCDDPIIRETLVAHEGQVVHPRLRELLGLARLEQAVLET